MPNFGIFAERKYSEHSPKVKNIYHLNISYQSTEPKI